MATAAHPSVEDVASRLLDHCAVLDLNDLRPSPGERLEELLGNELARLLRGALLGDYRSGWRSFD